MIGPDFYITAPIYEFLNQTSRLVSFFFKSQTTKSTGPNKFYQFRCMGASFYICTHTSIDVQLCKLIEHGIFFILSDVGLQPPLPYGRTSAPGKCVRRACRMTLNPKRPGGGADSAHRSGDRLPFLTGSYYGHKIS